MSSSKTHNEFIKSLLEMYAIEKFIVSESSKITSKVNDPKTKKIFNYWLSDSTQHAQTVKEIYGRHETSAFPDDASDHIKDVLATYNASALKKAITGSENSIEVKDLYNLLKLHVTLEGDAERRYSIMSTLTDGKKDKELLTALSKAEHEHHRQAQELLKTFESTFGDILSTAKK